MNTWIRKVRMWPETMNAAECWLWLVVGTGLSAVAFTIITSEHHKGITGHMVITTLKFWAVAALVVIVLSHVVMILWDLYDPPAKPYYRDEDPEYLSFLTPYVQQRYKTTREGLKGAKFGVYRREMVEEGKFQVCGHEVYLTGKNLTFYQRLGSAVLTAIAVVIAWVGCYVAGASFVVSLILAIILGVAVWCILLRYAASFGACHGCEDINQPTMKTVTTSVVSAVRNKSVRSSKQNPNPNKGRPVRQEVKVAMGEQQNDNQDDKDVIKDAPSDDTSKEQEQQADQPSAPAAEETPAATPKSMPAKKTAKKAAAKTAPSGASSRPTAKKTAASQAGSSQPTAPPQSTTQAQPSTDKPSDHDRLKKRVGDLETSKANRKVVEGLVVDVTTIKEQARLKTDPAMIAAVHGLSEQQVLDILGVKPKGETATQAEVDLAVQKRVVRNSRGVELANRRAAQLEERVGAVERLIGEAILSGGLKAGQAGGEKSFIHTLRKGGVSDGKIAESLDILRKDGNEELDLVDAELFAEFYTSFTSFRELTVERLDEHDERITRVEEIVEDGGRFAPWGIPLAIVVGLLVWLLVFFSPIGVHGDVRSPDGKDVTGSFNAGFSSGWLGVALGIIAAGIVLAFSVGSGRRTTTTEESNSDTTSSRSRWRMMRLHSPIVITRRSASHQQPADTSDTDPQTDTSTYPAPARNTAVQNTPA